MNTGISKINGKYQRIESLGDGGFGETYLVKDVNNPTKQYAAKRFIMSNSHIHFSKGMDLFKREAEILKKLDHPQIPKFVEFFEENKEFYLIQEYIHGKTLSDEIKDLQKLDENQVIQLLNELLKILDYLHSQNIIHRDIKPDNIIRCKNGKLFLIDFGLVKVKQFISTTNRENPVTNIGTEGYAPPEQISASPNPQFNSDIYALGITAIVALTGSQDLTLLRDQAGEFLWQDQVGVSNDLAKILSKMVRHNFTDRYQSVEKVQKDLNALLNSSSSETSIRIILQKLEEPINRQPLSNLPRIKQPTLGSINTHETLINYEEQIKNEDHRQLGLFAPNYLIYAPIFLGIFVCFMAIMEAYSLKPKENNTDSRKQSLLVEKVISSES